MTDSKRNVWVVTYQDWDTEGYQSPVTIVGVFTDYNLIPERFRNNTDDWRNYNIHEVELNKSESWH